MKVCAFGECLIDFTPYGVSEKGNFLYEQNPGGAPANLAVAIARQNGKSVFIGEVGQDMFGNFLVETLQKERVDTQGVIFSDRYNTSLAFVQLDSKGERNFTFYRNPGADVMIESRMINFNLINECEIFHFGSVSMTHNPARMTTFELLEYVKKQNKLITYDPNLREQLWQNLDEARYQIRKGLKYCDILKLTEDELCFITGKNCIRESVDCLQAEYDIPLILITRAEKGCLCKAHQHYLEVAAFGVEAIDSTGAGDAFFGSFLAGICQTLKGKEQITLEELKHCIRMGNAAGALATTVKGAIPSLPTQLQVEQFMKERCNEGQCRELD